MIHVIPVDLPGTDNLIEREEVQNKGQKLEAEDQNMLATEIKDKFKILIYKS